MPLELNCTPELGHLRSTVRRFVRDRLEPIALAIDATGQVPDHAIAQMREQGYLGMRLPPGQGGGGFDLSTYCLVMEEVARSHRVFTLIVGADPILTTCAD